MRGSGIATILVWIMKYRNKSKSSMSIVVIRQLCPFNILTCIVRRVEGTILGDKKRFEKKNDGIKKGQKGSNLDISTVKVSSTTIFIAHFGDARSTLAMLRGSRVPES